MEVLMDNDLFLEREFPAGHVWWLDGNWNYDTGRF